MANLGASNGIAIAGGTLQTGAALTETRAVALGSGGGTIDTNGNNSTFSGVFSGSDALTKSGAGTTTLSGANVYTGTTTIGAGRLNVNGSVTSATTVNSGGVLGGSGTIFAANIISQNSQSRRRKQAACDSSSK